MSYKSPYQTLSKRRRGRNLGPVFSWGLAAVLVLGGLFLGARGFLGDKGLGAIPFLASDTPTPTITATPTVDFTPTASAPFLYTVGSGDTLTALAERFQVDFILIMILNGLNNSSVLLPGEELIIPHPDMEIPEATALPEGIRRGTEVEYLVRPGDNLALIADQFLSTEDAIIEANELENPNQLFVGQLLLVPVNLVTATPGPSPTPTSEVSPTPEASATPTP